MSKKIIVVGSINLDLVAYASRMPTEGETLTGTGFAMVPGGKGANQAVGAARLGGKVAMVGRLGNDSFADTLRRGLAEAGVSTQCVENLPVASGVASITVSQRGGNSIVVIPGANAELRPSDLDGYLEEFRDASIVLAQLEIPMETVEHLARIAARFGLPFLLDPAPARKLSPELLRGATWLTPNEGEALTILRDLGDATVEGLESERSIAEAAARILAAGVRNLALKLGGRGVYIAGQDVDSEWIPAFAVEVLDTTAAGDAFNAGLAFASTEGFAMRAAAWFACAVAAISVTRRGAQPSMPSLAEVKDFLEQRGLSDLVPVP